MPRSDTDIPHFAFAHHRIGIHDKKVAADDEEGEAPELRPFLDLSHLGDVDQKRSLGLAYLAVSLREKDAGRVGLYQRRALELLTGAREAGLRDGDVDAALAQLVFDTGSGAALPYAESALERHDLAGQARCDALVVLAQEQGRRGNNEEAEAALRELMGLRRNAFDRLLLATCQRALGDDAASKATLAEAARINPRLWNVHRVLADYYRGQGDAERAAWHEKRAVP
jgi:hypothetical protein